MKKLLGSVLIFGMCFGSSFSLISDELFLYQTSDEYFFQTKHLLKDITDVTATIVGDQITLSDGSDATLIGKKTLEYTNIDEFKAYLTENFSSRYLSASEASITRTTAIRTEKDILLLDYEDVEEYPDPVLATSLIDEFNEYMTDKHIIYVVAKNTDPDKIQAFIFVGSSSFEVGESIAWLK